MSFSTKDRDDAYHCGVLLAALEEQERDPLKRMALANVRNFLNKLQRKLSSEGIRGKGQDGQTGDS